MLCTCLPKIKSGRRVFRRQCFSVNITLRKRSYILSHNVTVTSIRRGHHLAWTVLLKRDTVLGKDDLIKIQASRHTLAMESEASNPRLIKHTVCRKFFDILLRRMIRPAQNRKLCFVGGQSVFLLPLSCYCTSCLKRTQRIAPASPTASGELRSRRPGSPKHLTYIKRFPCVHLASKTIPHDHGSIC
jgi:hypothetical protein